MGLKVVERCPKCKERMEFHCVNLYNEDFDWFECPTCKCKIEA